MKLRLFMYLGLLCGGLYSCNDDPTPLPTSKNFITKYQNPVSICADKYLRDGDKFTIADKEIKFILTPGSTNNFSLIDLIIAASLPPGKSVLPLL